MSAVIPYSKIKEFLKSIDLNKYNGIKLSSGGKVDNVELLVESHCKQLDAVIGEDRRTREKKMVYYDRLLDLYRLIKLDESGQ